MKQNNGSYRDSTQAIDIGTIMESYPRVGCHYFVPSLAEALIKRRSELATLSLPLTLK
jgi:hypothetical protein